MKLIIYVLPVLLVVMACSSKEPSKSNVHPIKADKEEVSYRSPTRAELTEMESEVKSLLAQKEIKNYELYSYDLGKNYMAYLVTKTAAGDAFSDGCELLLSVFQLKNDTWTLCENLIDLGQSGQFGNCSFEQKDLTFFTDGKKIVGSIYNYVSHGGFSSGYISPFVLFKDELNFSPQITIEDDNTGMFDEDEPQYINLISDFYFEGRTNRIFLIVKTNGINQGEKVQKKEEYIMVGNKFQPTKNQSN